MTALKAKFDGQQIEVPAELRAASPRDVLIVFDEASVDADGRKLGKPSVWDAFGKASRQFDAADLEARMRAERDSWGER